MNVNDETILNLKGKIAEKKSQLKATEKFSPITNCSLELDGQRYNIHALDKDTLVYLMSKLQAILSGYQKLELEEELVVSGYQVIQWIGDMNSKLNTLNRKVEEDKLKAMEKRLNDLLSTDTKINLELKELESLLK